MMVSISDNIKKDFPLLQSKMHGQELVYLDNAATTQKPQVVLDKLLAYYQNDNANVYRGVYDLSQRATNAYAQARKKVAQFLNAPKVEEIIFTKGTTQSLNFIAAGFGMNNFQAGQEIVLSCAEHHSNLVPWQNLAKKKGLKLVYIDLNTDGSLDLKDADKKIGQKTALVAINHVSNVLGTINDVKSLANLAHKNGALIAVDGAQAAPHMKVDLKNLDLDFYAFSGHKMLGPTGIGVLWAKSDLLDAMTPLEFGGEMIDEVGLYETSYAKAPYKFEGGTPNIAGAIGLGVAIDYLTELGMDNIQAYEEKLVTYLINRLQEIEGLEIYGPKKRVSGIVSFNLKGLHPHDLATVLDMQGIAVRAGHHCAQPLMAWLDVPACARASLYFYNTKEDCDKLVTGIIKAKEFFENGF